MIDEAYCDYLDITQDKKTQALNLELSISCPYGHIKTLRQFGRKNPNIAISCPSSQSNEVLSLEKGCSMQDMGLPLQTQLNDRFKTYCLGNKICD